MYDEESYIRGAAMAFNSVCQSASLNSIVKIRTVGMMLRKQRRFKHTKQKPDGFLLILEMKVEYQNQNTYRLLFGV